MNKAEDGDMMMNVVSAVTGNRMVSHFLYSFLLSRVEFVSVHFFSCAIKRYNQYWFNSKLGLYSSKVCEYVWKTLALYMEAETEVVEYIYS